MMFADKMKVVPVLYFVILSTLMLFLVAPVSSLAQLKNERQGKQQNDADVVKILNCISSQQEAETVYIWSRTKEYKMDVTIEGQNTEPHVLHWYLINTDTGEYLTTDPPFGRDMSCIIEPYTLPTGKYQIYVNVSKYVNGALDPAPGKERTCYLVIKEEKPVCVIIGGANQMFPARQAVYVDGSDSIDMSVHQDSPSTLSYEWSCQQTQVTLPFCTGVVGYKSVLTIDAKYMEPGQKMDITMKATSSDGSWCSATQSLDLVDGATLIQIKCEKNCPPTSAASVPNINIVLYAGCEKECSHLQDEDYEWKLFIKKPLEELKSITGTGPKFIIKANKLMPNEYIAKVNLKSPHVGEATQLLHIIAPPMGVSCTIEPNAGRALQTAFKLNCKFPPNSNYFFEVYEAVGGKFPGELYSSFRSGLIDKIRFQLPAKKKFLVKVSNMEGASINLPLTAKVQSTLQNKSPEKLQEQLNALLNGDANNGNSIEKMLMGKDKEEAILMIQQLIGDIVKVKDKSEQMDNVIDDLKERVIKDLLNTPITTLNHLLHTATPISKLVSFKDKPKTDPELAKLTSTICRKMAAVQLDLVRKERYPLSLGATINKVSGSLLQCIDANTNPNPDIQESKFVVDDTTPHPLLSIDTPTENYADYENFGNAYYTHMNDLSEATYNTINTTATAAKVSALTTAVGEKFVKIAHDHVNTVVAKDKGSFLAKHIITSHQLTLTPSQDFAGKDHPFDILLTTWSKDILWWNPQHLKTLTDLMYVEFWHSTCKKRISHFTLPVHIHFNITRPSKSDVIIDGDVTVPANFATISGRDLDELMYVRRVTLKKYQGLQVKFLNAADSKKFNVISTIFRYPTNEDFDQYETVDSKKSYINIGNTHDYNVWAYVGILPTKDTNAAGSIKFQMTFAKITCIKWLFANKSWEPTCTFGSETTDTMIHCSCHEFSVLSGYSENIESLPQTLEEVEIVLELQVFWIVFIWVAVLFTIYCFFLLVALKKCKKNIYFLGDNYRMDRWCYLIVVKTSDALRSGTTSNVMIRLTGNYQTQAYVLNYPDPDKIMLQRQGEDWYVLCTDRYLRKIEMIELWLDGIGSHCSWYCNYVLIYDVQSGNEWYFHVDQKLGLFPKDTHVTVNVFDPNKVQPKRPKSCWKSVVIYEEANTWCLGRCSQNFPYITRITILFSTIILAGALALIVYHVPSFEDRDCLDYYGHYQITGWFALAILSSSLISFGIHACIKLGLRHGKYLYFLASWIVLLSVIIVSMTILVVFGFLTPLYTSLLWLTVCTIDIVLIALVYETVFNWSRNFCFAPPKTFPTVNIRKYVQQILDNVQRQRVILFRTLGDYLLRPYFQHLYSPLTREESDVRTEWMITRMQVIAQFKDLIMFGIYLIILYVVILSNKDSYTVLSGKEMVDMMEGRHTRSLAFSDIQTFEDVYEYINDTFIPALQNLQWYGTFSVDLPGIMVDFTTKYLGVARLRQHRTYDVPCDDVGFEKTANSTRCSSEFSTFTSDSRKYGYLWKFPRLLHDLDRLRSIWTHRSALETGAFCTFGEISMYYGDGYVASLGRTKYNSHANLDEFKRNSWIDVGSRSVFIEFLTYNANYNIFTAVKLLFEQSVTGYTKSTIFVEPARMLYVQSKLQRLTSIIFVLFVFWVAVLIFERSKWMVGIIKRTYKDSWFVVDVIILVMSIICIALFVVRIYMIGSYLQHLETSHNNVFINYFYLFQLDHLLTVFGAFLVCVATIRLWKLLRFGSVFLLMEKTIFIASRTLGCFLVFHILVLVGFAWFAFVTFHEKDAAFSSLKNTLTTLTIFAMGFTRKGQETLYKMNRPFFAAFLLVTFIIRVVYVIVIMLSYQQAMQICSELPASYNLKNYAAELMKYMPRYLGAIWRRLRGGSSADLVRPKNELIYYDSSQVIRRTRMAMMRAITLGLLKNGLETKTKLNEDDVKAMLKITRPLLVKRIAGITERKEVFFKGHIPGERVKFVDVKRLELMRSVVENVLKLKK